MSSHDVNLADLLDTAGFRLASPDLAPSAVVAVRRHNDGRATIESWLLDPRVTDELDSQCRREAKTIADGIVVIGEILVVFSLTPEGSPAVARVALEVLGLVDR